MTVKVRRGVAYQDEVRQRVNQLRIEVSDLVEAAKIVGLGDLAFKLEWFWHRLGAIEDLLS